MTRGKKLLSPTPQRSMFSRAAGQSPRARLNHLSLGRILEEEEEEEGEEEQ